MRDAEGARSRDSAKTELEGRNERLRTQTQPDTTRRSAIVNCILPPTSLSTTSTHLSSSNRVIDVLLSQELSSAAVRPRPDQHRYNSRHITHQSQCPRSFSGAVSVRISCYTDQNSGAKTHDILQASPSASGNSALRCVPSSSATPSGHTLCSAALAQASATGCKVLKRDSCASSKRPRNHCSRREEDAPRERAASTLVPTTRRTRRASLLLPLPATVLPQSNIKS